MATGIFRSRSAKKIVDGDSPEAESRGGADAARSAASAKESRRAALREAMEKKLGRDPVTSPGGTMLVNFTPVSSTTVHGKSAVFGGILFFGMGVAIVLMAYRIIPVDDYPSDAPPLLLATFGAIFAVPGLWLMTHGITSHLAFRRVRRLREEGVTQPWRWDYPWNENRAKDTQARGVGQMLFGASFMLLFVAPFNFVAVASENGMVMTYVFACVDIFAAVFVSIFVYRLVRWMKYGSGKLGFRRFPFFLGEKLEVDYIPARRLKGVTQLTCTLRCVREAYETSGTGENATTRINCYETHKIVQEIDAAAFADSFDRSIALTFDIPAKGEANRLSERPPTYWQLEVAAETPGVNLQSRFLLPIYARTAKAQPADPVSK